VARPRRPNPVRDVRLYKRSMSARVPARIGVGRPLVWVSVAWRGAGAVCGATEDVCCGDSRGVGSCPADSLAGGDGDGDGERVGYGRQGGGFSGQHGLDGAGVDSACPLASHTIAADRARPASTNRSTTPSQNARKLSAIRYTQRRLRLGCSVTGRRSRRTRPTKGGRIDARRRRAGRLRTC